MNKVVLMGRLTRDPETRYTEGQNPLCISRYTLAVDRRFKREGDEQTADFISCVAFGRQGEFAEKYLHKGTKLVVVGRIQTGSYTNRDNQKVYTTEVVVEENYFAESKSAEDANRVANPEGSPASSQREEAPAKQEQTAPADDDFMNIPDDIDMDLPFL